MASSRVEIPPLGILPILESDTDYPPYLPIMLKKWLVDKISFDCNWIGIHNHLLAM